MKMACSLMAWASVLLLATASISTADDFTNGNFESGNWDGWDVEYGRSKANGSVDWGDEQSGQPPPAVLTSASPLMLHQDLRVDPFCGSNLLRINDLQGGFHATEVSQKTQLHAGNHCGGFVRVRWGAMLEYALGHTDDQQSWFRIELKVDGDDVACFEANSNDSIDPANGWQSAGDEIFYKSDEFIAFIGPGNGGADVEVTMQVRDCSVCGHGGAAFIDCVELVENCNSECLLPAQRPIPEPLLPNVITPNGDGINDVWTIGGLFNTCSVHVDIFNRWGNKLHEFNNFEGSGFLLARMPVWDGRTGGSLVSEGTYYYTVKLQNCVDQIDRSGYITVFH